MTSDKRFSLLDDCLACKGTGRRKAGEQSFCPQCQGTGRKKSLEEMKVDLKLPAGVLVTSDLVDMANQENLAAFKESHVAVNPKTAAGSKKAPMRFIPPAAFIAESRVFELGAEKYGAFNWREAAVPASIYYEAALRHLFAWYDGENVDEESGQSHLAHVRACMAILIDAGRSGTLHDDRPTPGGSPALLQLLISKDD